MSAVQATEPRQTTYDPAARRKGLRTQRQRGCMVYIPAEVLIAAGFSPDEPPPFYRTVGHKRSRNAGSVIVSLYRDP